MVHRHLIGNLEATVEANVARLRLCTAFLVYRSHLETDSQLLSGRREDVLRKVEGARGKWRGARSVLDANVLHSTRTLSSGFSSGTASELKS